MTASDDNAKDHSGERLTFFVGVLAPLSTVIGGIVTNVLGQQNWLLALGVGIVFVALVGILSFRILHGRMVVTSTREAKVDGLEADIAVASPIEAKVDGLEAGIVVASTGDAEFDGLVAGISDGLRQARTEVNSPIFRELILAHGTAFRERVELWKDGRFLAQGDDYEEVLKTIYALANKVFSTTVHEYLYVWSGDLGPRLLEAHRSAIEKSKSDVTRIFLFKSMQQIYDGVKDTKGELIDTRRLLALMQEQEKVNIKVMVYIAQGNIRWVQSRNNRSMDFTIINDGEAVAQTMSFENKEEQAEWQFLPDQAQRQGSMLRWKRVFDASLTYTNFQVEYKKWCDDHAKMISPSSIEASQ